MLIGPGKLIPSEWVAELLVRLHQKIDADYTAAETD
jgi:hypothetical protein